MFSSDFVSWKTPWAAAPRAWTTRSGMRSWSKCMIFSRRWKSSSRVGPRELTRRLLSVSSTFTPSDVVSASPLWPHEGVSASSRGVAVVPFVDRFGAVARAVAFLIAARGGVDFLAAGFVAREDLRGVGTVSFSSVNPVRGGSSR